MRALEGAAKKKFIPREYRFLATWLARSSFSGRGGAGRREAGAGSSSRGELRSVGRRAWAAAQGRELATALGSARVRKAAAVGPSRVLSGFQPGPYVYVFAARRGHRVRGAKGARARGSAAALACVYLRSPIGHALLVDEASDTHRCSEGPRVIRPAAHLRFAVVPRLRPSSLMGD